MGTTEVIPANDQSRVPAVTESMALISMIERAARDPSVDMDKMDRLLVMHERMQLAAKEQAFNDAMAEAQAEMEPIRRDCDNPQTRSKYASYAALDRTVRPIYSKHGFGVSFNTQAPRSGKIESDIGVVAYVTCKGFTRLYEIDMPADGKGAKGGDVMTRTHATGSGLTYGRRYLLQMIFNLATETQGDDDGNAAGGKPAGQMPRQEQDRQPSPPADPSKPHKLVPLKGDTFGAWSARFIAFVDATDTAEGLKAWDDLNTEVLGKIHAARHIDAKSKNDEALKAAAIKAYPLIEASFARCHERIAAVAKKQQQDDGKKAPGEAAGAPSIGTGKDAAQPAKAAGGAPAAGGDRFPEPWIKQSPEIYVTFAERWLEAAPNEAVPTSKAIDDRWDAERKIRNGLADKVAGPQVEHLVEIKGAAKARAKANPFVVPTAVADVASSPVADAQPTGERQAGGGFSLPQGTGSLTMVGGDGKPHTTVNPEGFIRWVEKELYPSCKTVEELEKWHNSQVEPQMPRLLEPDQDEILRLFRKREAELTP